MSTEKDREVANKIAEAWQPATLSQLNVNIYGRHCALHGIQYARQGERERLVRFAERIRIFLRDYSGVHSYAHEINVVVNDFLEQESK